MIRVAAYKPIATGVLARCDDAERHAAASRTDYLHPTYAYRRPVSPHLAAREEARPIDLEVIRKRSEELAYGVDLLIVEGAGGLFTPLSGTITNVELVQSMLPAVVVLVAPNRLGVLHDLGATVEAARARGIKISALVLSSTGAPDESTSSNAAEIKRLGLGPLAGILPRAPAEDLQSQNVMPQLWNILGLPG